MSEAPAPGLFDLRGQVALVTGAAGGLGQAIALAYAGQGADLVLSDRDAAGAEAVAARCRDSGVRAQVQAADLADPGQAEALGARAAAVFGRIDTLVCNAGMQGPAGPGLATERADWDRVFQVNLASAQALCAALVPAMAARRAGEPHEVAGVAVLLAAAAGPFISGQTLVVDGGTLVSDGMDRMAAQA